MLYGHGDFYNTMYADMHVETPPISPREMEQANPGATNANWLLQETVWEDLFQDMRSGASWQDIP